VPYRAVAVVEQVFGCIGACGLGQDIKPCNIDCLCSSVSNGYFFLKYLRIASARTEFLYLLVKEQKKICE